MLFKTEPYPVPSVKFVLQFIRFDSIKVWFIPYELYLNSGLSKTLVGTISFLQKSFIFLNTVFNENFIIHVQPRGLMLTAFRINQNNRMTKKRLKPFSIRVLSLKHSLEIHWKYIENTMKITEIHWMVFITAKAVSKLSQSLILKSPRVGKLCFVKHG